MKLFAKTCEHANSKLQLCQKLIQLFSSWINENYVENIVVCREKFRVILSSYKKENQTEQENIKFQTV